MTGVPSDSFVELCLLRASVLVEIGNNSSNVQYNGRLEYLETLLLNWAYYGPLFQEIGVQSNSNQSYLGQWTAGVPGDSFIKLGLLRAPYSQKWEYRTTPLLFRTMDGWST